MGYQNNVTVHRTIIDSSYNNVIFNDVNHYKYITYLNSVANNIGHNIDYINAYNVNYNIINDIKK